jgi:hypothetical protein
VKRGIVDHVGRKIAYSLCRSGNVNELRRPRPVGLHQRRRRRAVRRGDVHRLADRVGRARDRNRKLGLEGVDEAVAGNRIDGNVWRDKAGDIGIIRCIGVAGNKLIACRELNLESVG